MIMFEDTHEGDREMIRHIPKPIKSEKVNIRFLYWHLHVLHNWETKFSFNLSYWSNYNGMSIWNKPWYKSIIEINSFDLFWPGNEKE